MNEAPIDQLIQYRLDQATETLYEAETLFRSSYWRGVTNRSYYAMFYAVLALAVYRQEITSKHSGAIAFFDREFVKKGIFTKETSRSLHLAFERRQNNDYGEIFTVNEEEAKQALTEAKAFLKTVIDYLLNVRT